jgi:two-component system LytT family response regulator
MKVLIVDDEISAIASIETALKEYCDNIEIVGTATSAKEGIACVRSTSPDLVFLDIQMPHMSGIEMLEAIGDVRPFEVVFVTAFNEYAVKAFKLCALDYLLKPINIIELINSVKKINSRKNIYSTQERVQTLRAAMNGKLAIPVSNGIEFIDVDEIIRVRAEGSYTSIFCINSKPKLVSKNLREIEDALEGYGFFRTHKSHLVNLKYIKKYLPVKDGGTIEMTDGSVIDLARSHKVELTGLLTHLKK